MQSDSDFQTQTDHRRIEFDVYDFAGPGVQPRAHFAVRFEIDRDRHRDPLGILGNHPGKSIRRRMFPHFGNGLGFKDEFVIDHPQRTHLVPGKNKPLIPFRPDDRRTHRLDPTDERLVSAAIGVLAAKVRTQTFEDRPENLIRHLPVPGDAKVLGVRLLSRQAEAFFLRRGTGKKHARQQYTDSPQPIGHCRKVDHTIPIEESLATKIQRYDFIRCQSNPSPTRNSNAAFASAVTSCSI